MAGSQQIVLVRIEDLKAKLQTTVQVDLHVPITSVHESNFERYLMGIASATYCEDCNEQAPEIGDQGMLGNPSLEAAREYHADWGVNSYTFGWIYDALKGICLVPRDVEAYRQFLKKHTGHKVVLVSDHDDMETNIDWDNLSTFTSFNGEFIYGKYELEARNGDTFQSSPESFLKFEEKNIDSRAIDNIFGRLFEDRDCFEYFHHTSTVIDPYDELERLETFLRQHRNETIVARIVEM